MVAWIEIRTPADVIAGRFRPEVTVLSLFADGVRRSRAALNLP